MSFVDTRKIAREFNGIALWDKRCVTSIKRISKSILKEPSKSFSSACGKSLRQNGSRILSNNLMTTNKLQSSHYKETHNRCKVASKVLVVQDTTSFNYKTHRATTGLGMISTSNREEGIMLHSALALTRDGIPLGLVHQKYWVRKKVVETKEKQRKLPVTTKESNKWIEGLQSVNERISLKVKDILVISDRESDLYEYFVHPRTKNTNLLIRVMQPRTITIDYQGQVYEDKIKALLPKLSIAGSKKVEITNNNKPEELEVIVSYGKVELSPPQQKLKSGLPKIKMTLIYVKAKSKESDIEWILLSSKTDITNEEAIELTDNYTQRWRIERLHYTLKTGVFNVEKLQFDDATTLINALSLYSVLAWYVMYIMYYCRQHPEQEPSVVVDKVSLAILSKYTKTKITTAHQVMLAIAHLGGYLGGTKKYPNPGIKVMWQGLTKLDDLKQGWLLAKGGFNQFYATG